MEQQNEDEDEDEEFKTWSHSNNNIDMNFICIHTISSWNATWMKCICASTSVCMCFSLNFNVNVYISVYISIIRLERTLWFQLNWRGEENKLDFHCLFLARVYLTCRALLLSRTLGIVEMYWIQIICIYVYKNAIAHRPYMQYTRRQYWKVFHIGINRLTALWSQPSNPSNTHTHTRSLTPWVGCTATTTKNTFHR